MRNRPTGSPEVLRPALVVHMYVAVTGPRAVEHRHRLDDLWHRLGTELDAPPRSVGRIEVRTAPGEVLRQAVLRTEHDIHCLSVALTGGTWQELDALWNRWAGDTPEWALGVCRLFVAYVDGSPGQDLTPGVLAALPGSYTYGRTTTTGDFALWEVGIDRDDRVLRTFALLAPLAAEHQLDAWVWSAGDDRMTPFARYLMHTAKVRYELKVYAQGDGFRRARQGVDDQVDGMLGMLDADELPAFRVELAEKQAATAGLIRAMTRLREMRRTLEIARHNMRDEGLQDDIALTDWFILRLDDDIAYAEATRERAREIGAIADLVIGERLQRRIEHRERRWERLAVLEAAVLGTLLMMLTAIQALNYHVPMPDQVKPYVVLGLGVMAFVLTAVGYLRWRRAR
ncbi:CATRA conflict system CASPASE/TPR repeat-associated protein [Streptomyces mirabilis]|uniref:CATRA conflict system CASPASE/TPR repeat-associated protein n=1 Tax=Streptomyces mirabilis TaxID=68239 RepID=UPI0036DC1D9D